MKKKIFAAVASLSLLATVALGVAVNSSDHLAISLPGNYNVQFSTSYVGPERMRSVALVKLNGAVATTTRETAQACPADQAPTGQVVATAAQACPADQAPTGQVVATATQACPADQAPTGQVLASAAQACPADQTPTTATFVKVLGSLF